MGVAWTTSMCAAHDVRPKTSKSMPWFTVVNLMRKECIKGPRYIGDPPDVTDGIAPTTQEWRQCGSLKRLAVLCRIACCVAYILRHLYRTYQKK